MTKQPSSDSMESFEHVMLDEDRGQQQPATATAAAAAPSDGRPPEAGAAAAPAADAEAAAGTSPELPPATQALASVLSFFGAGAASPPPDKQQQVEQRQQQQQQGAEEEPEDPEQFDAVDAFEKEAAEMAHAAQQAAEEVGQKLLHGAAEAKESLASLAQGLTSWWSKLDPLKEAGGSGEGTVGGGGSARQGPEDLQAAATALGLEAGETVLESFACSLLQTYTATNNFYTAPREVAFPGSLHLTSGRLCFAFGEQGVAPIKLAGKALKGVAKLPADAAKGLLERLEVQLVAKGQSLVLANFALQELELDSALALLEHLVESSAS